MWLTPHQTRVTLLRKKLTVNLKKLPREDMICGNACVCIRRCDLWKRRVVNKHRQQSCCGQKRVCTYVVGGRVGMGRHLLFHVRSEKTWPHPTPPQFSVASKMCSCARNIKEQHHLRRIRDVFMRKERHHPHPTPPHPKPPHCDHRRTGRITGNYIPKSRMLLSNAQRGSNTPKWQHTTFNPCCLNRHGKCLTRPALFSILARVHRSIQCCGRWKASSQWRTRVFPMDFRCTHFLRTLRG